MQHPLGLVIGDAAVVIEVPGPEQIGLESRVGYGYETPLAVLHALVVRHSASGKDEE